MWCEGRGEGATWSEAPAAASEEVRKSPLVLRNPRSLLAARLLDLIGTLTDDDGIASRNAYKRFGASKWILCEPSVGIGARSRLMPIVFVADAVGLSASGCGADHAGVFTVWDGGAAWTEV